MDRLVLLPGQTDLPVTARLLPSLQLRQRAADADQPDRERRQLGDADISQFFTAEAGIGQHVMPGGHECPQGAIVTEHRTGECLLDDSRLEIAPVIGAVDKPVFFQVDVGSIQNRLQLFTQTGLARTRRPVEEKDILRVAHAATIERSVAGAKRLYGRLHQPQQCAHKFRCVGL